MALVPCVLSMLWVSVHVSECAQLPVGLMTEQQFLGTLCRAPLQPGPEGVVVRCGKTQTQLYLQPAGGWVVCI